MEAREPFCFIIMPFLPELNYFYLYLQEHLRRSHGVHCERADAAVLTIPLLDKITAAIRAADVVIADCSGRNANVFYELGIAHTLEKPVVLITSDDLSQAPTDIRHFEFIRYSLNDHRSFLDRLDNAIRNVFAHRYGSLYSQANEIFERFRSATGVKIAVAPRDLFAQRVRSYESLSPVPSPDERHQFVEFSLPRIVLDSSDATVMQQVMRYIAQVKGELPDAK